MPRTDWVFKVMGSYGKVTETFTGGWIPKGGSPLTATNLKLILSWVGAFLRTQKQKN